MGETPIILLPVVAPEPHIKSRTPSDSAIVAIFQDKRKPQTVPKNAFPLDFTGIFAADGDWERLAQAATETSYKRGAVRHGATVRARLTRHRWLVTR
jgi:hypothetical protein